MQGELQFPVSGLTVEHNRHGQDSVFQENREHFASQTEKVLEHLKKGEIVTGQRMYDLHGIQDVRPRKAAIKAMCKALECELQEMRIPGMFGAKAFWFDEETIKIFKAL